MAANGDCGIGADGIEFVNDFVTEVVAAAGEGDAGAGFGTTGAVFVIVCAAKVTEGTLLET